jgi:hypothetical protein
MSKTLRSRVTTIADARAVSGTNEDPYLAKLLRYIPGEIVAAYLALFNAAKAAFDPAALSNILLWVIGILVVLTPLWILIATRDPQKPTPYFQAVAATVAFLVWLFAIPETPFSQLIDPFYGFLALVISTLVMPIIEKIFVK